MAFIYSDYLSVEHRPVYAVMWTLSGGAVTTVVFSSVYELGLLYRGVGWGGRYDSEYRGVLDNGRSSIRERNLRRPHSLRKHLFRVALWY
ncbi:MAG: hypothetical protein J07HQW1_01323 [Haloquadratum walsbyi J07HQW1]|uniref:Uncharacterized protein n=1 Tax=Haloquadratum walsbyi J07HQW1 TaxID=1238424 RepID=U1MN91_9EURY|nr:MAG: hypothetical protein J07HQW1_01323 [Haloquadratum walsbyi J07HQW1]